MSRLSLSHKRQVRQIVREVVAAHDLQRKLAAASVIARIAAARAEAREIDDQSRETRASFPNFVPAGFGPGSDRVEVELG